ncbi:MAG TPA: TIGR03435 family protein [Bryobacteraceae bacterium]|nr:TIGR03435 family protein [Bryobacteraceae bacterium]
MRQFFVSILALSGVVGAFGQSAATTPKAEFEVASIRPAEPLSGATMAHVGVHIDGAMVNCASLSLRDYIVAAYQVKFYQIIGPEWLSGDRFDISAKLPEGAIRSQVPAMLQALLADRFEMKAHRDTKELPVYALTVGKGGPKMKESPLDEESAETPGGRGAVNVNVVGGRGGTNLQFGRGSSFSFSDNKITATKLSMQVFVDTLGRFLDRPVVDQTGLTGTYDFELPFTAEDFRAMQIRAALAAGVVLPPQALQALEGASGDSLFSAVQGIGLKLESKKAPVEVVVVDSVRKAPTAN